VEGVDLSVVVATHSRSERLAALLRSLAQQERAPVFEVVAVADGADPGVAAVLAAPPDGLRLRVERHAVARGPAAARNTGWRAAAGHLVAFTDDDCVASPGWLAALAAAAGPDRLVQGRVEPLPAESDRIGPFARTLWVRDVGPFFQTANILYPRAVLERLGGFDEAYPFPAGEDTDLGWRAREVGAEAVYAEDALVWHAVHEMGPAALVRDARRWGTAVRIVKRHPQLRRHFQHGVFWKPSHERLLLAAAGLALARRTRGASLALAAPYLLAHRTEHPSRDSLVRALPAHLAVDAAELAAMARGSLEQRTLLL
jgi:GT2 family glycosyltransferase